METMAEFANSGVRCKNPNQWKYMERGKGGLGPGWYQCRYWRSGKGWYWSKELAPLPCSLADKRGAAESGKVSAMC
jgi:hypothetical protein